MRLFFAAVALAASAFAAPVASAQNMVSLMSPISPPVSDIALTTTIDAIAGSPAGGTSGSRNSLAQALFGTDNPVLSSPANSMQAVSVGGGNHQDLSVQGSSSHVGFVQLGNNMNGSLTVDNSSNADVLAIQVHPNQFMPTAIHGIRNATVIIGPGRMYVFPKR